MSQKNKTPRIEPVSQPERSFIRFSLSQRWEHTLLFITFTILLLTGLPQKYRSWEISHQLLSTPERVATIQQFHHIAAAGLSLLIVYYLGKILVRLSQRRQPGDMLPTWQDVKDAWQMVLYLLFLSKEKPAFGRYNFEQKFTYWFLVFSIGIMVISGFIIWFPEAATRMLPGGIVPAAKLAHSTEAIVSAIFIVIWHFYHVHIERLNLSIFTGRISEGDMKNYHAREYQRLTGKAAKKNQSGG